MCPSFLVAWLVETEAKGGDADTLPYPLWPCGNVSKALRGIISCPPALERAGGVMGVGKGEREGEKEGKRLRETHEHTPRTHTRKGEDRSQQHTTRHS